MPMRADAGGGQVHRRRRSESARADAEHAAGLQLALPVDADLRHDQMPAVALDFVVGQLRKLAVRDWTAAATSRAVYRARRTPPATDGMMLIVSPGFTGVCSFCR